MRFRERLRGARCVRGGKLTNGFETEFGKLNELRERVLIRSSKASSFSLCFGLLPLHSLKARGRLLDARRPHLDVKRGQCPLPERRILRVLCASMHKGSGAASCVDVVKIIYKYQLYVSRFMGDPGLGPGDAEIVAGILTGPPRNRGWTDRYN